MRTPKKREHAVFLQDATESMLLSMQVTPEDLDREMKELRDLKTRLPFGLFKKVEVS